MPEYNDNNISNPLSSNPEINENEMDEQDLKPLENYLKNKTKSILIKYSKEKNLTSYLNEDQLAAISSKVIAGVDEDKLSQRKWLMDVNDAEQLTKLVKEPKNTPLPQSANIKYPLITTACYQFAARTYPELIHDGRIVKCEIIGVATPQLQEQAERISMHMSSQLLGVDSEWEASTDKLLVVLPAIGFVVKKTYYDTLKRKNVSDVCNYKDIILRNDPSIQCLNDLRRITHVLYYHPNDLIENARYGLFDEEAVEEIMAYYTTNQINPVCELYEQHRYLDLDEDGYEEPYIVTVAKDCNKVVRIIARYTEDDIEFEDNKVMCIKPVQYFTDYHFLPAPDGSFMSYGFGTLMLHLNETVNVILNQLIDAGTLANMQTGFIDSRIKVMGGQTLMDPGQWNRVKGVIGQNLKEGILPITYKEPSNVLFQLLGMLISASKELTSSTDALQGSMPAQNVPATTMLAMVEQGMKMFSAIQRRLYRALKEEYQKIFRLNSKYLADDEYAQVMGPNAVKSEDYKTKSIRVIPIADPNLSSDAQRLSQAQIVMALADKPGVNTYEIYRRFLQAAKVPNIELILDPKNAHQTQQPDPNMMKLQVQAQSKEKELQIKDRAQSLKEKEFIAKLSKIEAEVTQMQANALKLVSDAANSHKQTNLSVHQAKLQAAKDKIDAIAQAHKQIGEQNLATHELLVKQQIANQQNDQANARLAHDKEVAANDRSNSAQPNNGMDETPDNNSSAQSPEGA